MSANFMEQGLNNPGFKQSKTCLLISFMFHNEVSLLCKMSSLTPIATNSSYFSRLSKTSGNYLNLPESRDRRRHSMRKQLHGMDKHSGQVHNVDRTDFPLLSQPRRTISVSENWFMVNIRSRCL